MKVSTNRSCKKRVEDKKKNPRKQPRMKNNFLNKHKLQDLKTVETILDDENIIYTSSIPLNKQILKDVPFVKLMHDNITKKKLYLMRLHARIDLDDNNILTDPKMIKQIPYVKIQELESQEVTPRKSLRTTSKQKTPMVHSTPTRSSRRCTPIVISSDDEDDNRNELSTENISPIKRRRRKSDLSLKEKNLLSPSIMKASNEKSNVKKKVSFAESVSFLEDELEDSDESYSNEKKKSTSKDKKNNSEVNSRKSKRLKQNTESETMVDEIDVAETSSNKQIKPSASHNKHVISARKSKRITDLNNKPMPASKRRNLMERIRNEEGLSKKQKPMPASKKRQYEEKQKQKNRKPDTSNQDNNISEILKQKNKESVAPTDNENEAPSHKNKNSETHKKFNVKPMPASMKRKLLSKMMKKPMPASKRRLLEEKFNEEELIKDSGIKRKIIELPESSSSSLKKLKRNDLLKPMPASQRRKLENRLKKQEELDEQIQNACNSDDDDGDTEADFDKINHDSECDSPIPGNMSAEMLHKRDHVSKSKKRYSLDCSGLETKNLLSEFSSEDETDDVIILNSDDDDQVDAVETKEETQNTDKIVCRKTGRKRKQRIPFISPTANKQIVKIKRKIQVLNNSILKLKKKREIKIRFKKTKEYKCDVCFKAYMEKCNLQLHFLKHVQPLEIEIRLYRYKLPIHFNVTPYNEQKFLKSKREMNRFLNEDINNLVNKYVAHRDEDTDDQKASGSIPESMDDTEEQVVILDNVLISTPNKQTDNDEEENESELVESNMDTSVETVIHELAIEGSQCETDNIQTNQTETLAEDDREKSNEGTSELNSVENELESTKENQLSTVETSKDNDDSATENEEKSDEKKSEEEGDTSNSDLEKVDKDSQLNINEDVTVIVTDSDDVTIDDSKDEGKVDKSSEKQDKQSDEDIEKDSIDVEENIVNLESKSEELVSISEETSSKDGSDDAEIIEETDKSVEIFDKLIDGDEETQPKCVEISKNISKTSVSEVEKITEIETESSEKEITKLDDLKENSNTEEITVSTSKESDNLHVTAEEEETSEANVEIEDSTTENNTVDKEIEDAKENESVNNDAEESETEESTTKSSGNGEEATTEEVDEVSDVVESAENKEILTDEDSKKSVEEENRDEDKEDDLHLCVESDDTQDAGIVEDTTEETASAKKNEEEDKLVSTTVAKSGDFEKFLKCFDTESLKLPSTSSTVVMSQAELINTLESPKGD